MKTLNQFVDEQMKDEAFKQEYNNLQPEFDIIRALVNTRTSQNLTQQELAEKTGINQSDISKIENGTRNPSLSMLKKLADGMDMYLKLEFVSKKKSQ
jgi:transcriptional regulator with XRE-family HTH domain